MKVEKNFDLKQISWIKIGGIAKEYVEIESKEEFIAYVQQLSKSNEEFEVLGWAANTLISDQGLDKIVIKNKVSGIEILDLKEEGFQRKTKVGSTNIRYKVEENINVSKGFKHGYASEDINYTEPDAEDALVKIDAGVGLPYVINYLIGKGITGLHMFSGIPGTVGGSVFNNIHGGPTLLSEFLYSIEIINEVGDIQILRAEDIHFDYNKTPFQDSKVIIISATFALKLGDKERARNASVEWARRKATQPKNSLGSVFHNFSEEEKKQFNLPSVSAGYLIEHQLKLRGFGVGGVMIPEEANTNIFINTGNGTAKDYLKVMKKVYNEAYQMFGIRMKPEVFLKGFDKKEIELFL